MANKKKYGDLVKGTSEWRRAQRYCLKFDITYEEYAKGPDKYGKSVHNREFGSPEWKKSSRLKTWYGITLDEYNIILERQEGKCAILKDDLSGNKSTHVDHCHKTNKVRGILCRSCNLGLGFFKDSKDSLKSAQDYLDS